jgi:hypothetical protein
VKRTRDINKGMNPTEISAEKTKRLAAQWPKKHTHANGFDGGSTIQLMPGDWSKLPIAYIHEDAYCKSEARNCPCGSTLQVMTEINDLAEE